MNLLPGRAAHSIKYAALFILSVIAMAAGVFLVAIYTAVQIKDIELSKLGLFSAMPLLLAAMSTGLSNFLPETTIKRIKTLLTLPAANQGYILYGTIFGLSIAGFLAPRGGSNILLNSLYLGFNIVSILVILVSLLLFIPILFNIRQVR